MMSDAFESESLSVEPENLHGDFFWLLHYWNEKRGAAPMPAWKSIRLVDFPTSILQWLIIVDVIDDGKDFRFRYWGTERTKLQGVDMTGKSVLDLASSGMANGMMSQYGAVMETMSPVLNRNAFEVPSGLVVEFEALRLPVSDVLGEKIDKIFALSRFIRNRDDLYRYFGTEPPRD